jgi:hypothetical protein
MDRERLRALLRDWSIRPTRRRRQDVRAIEASERSSPPRGQVGSVAAPYPGPQPDSGKFDPELRRLSGVRR